MSKYYEIPCSWEVYGTVEVEASRLEEAIKLAEDTELYGLPETYDYIDGSFEVDRDVAEEMNKDDKSK